MAGDGTASAAVSGSFDERHLVDFAPSRDSLEHLLDGGLAQEPHALIAGGLLDLGCRPPPEDQFANVVAQIQQLADRGAAAVAGAAAFHTAGALEEQPAVLERGVERRF